VHIRLGKLWLISSELVIIARKSYPWLCLLVLFRLSTNNYLFLKQTITF